MRGRGWGVRGALLGGVAAAALGIPGLAGERIAAVVDGEPVPLAVVDAASEGKAERLRARLRAVAAGTLDTLIGERLEALAGARDSPLPVEVSDAEVAAFRAERAADFEGPHAPEGSARDPAVQRAAIRHYLEERARRRARRAALASLRAEHEVERALPETSALEAPLEAERVVARVGGDAIRAGALEARAAVPLYRLRGQLARERLRRLEAWIDAHLLGRAAARRGTTVEALVGDAAEAVSEEDVQAYVAAEARAGRPAPDPARARPYLAFRARRAARNRLLERLRSEAEVEIRVREPAPPRLPVRDDGAPALGPADGARLVVYSNYRCRACRIVHEELDRLLASDAGVRIVFRDWLPHYDPGAREAAALARCAHREGRFAAARRALLRGDPPPFGRSWSETDPGLAGLEAETGLDPEALRRCAESDAVRAAIRRDSEQARALGFDAAPSFVAEGVPLSGVQSAAGLARAVCDALAGRPAAPNRD